LDDARVVCDAGQIVEVGPSAEVPPAEVELALDGVLMPAAADRHVHIELADPVRVLRRGVTAVRDLGWPAGRIFPLADLSETPSFDGPLIRACGPMLTGPGGYPTQATWAPEGTGRAVHGPQDASEAVDELAAAGAAAVKVSLNAVGGPTPDDVELLSICEAAARHGLSVTAHAEGPGQVERALGAGVDELAHTPWTHRLPDDLLHPAAPDRVDVGHPILRARDT
jgi:imidazolonepropionase-like amidohydrolase